MVGNQSGFNSICCMVQPNFGIVRAHVYTSKRFLGMSETDPTNAILLQQQIMDKIDPCHTLYNDMHDGIIAAP